MPSSTSSIQIDTVLYTVPVSFVESVAEHRIVLTIRLPIISYRFSQMKQDAV